MLPLLLLHLLLLPMRHLQLPLLLLLLLPLLLLLLLQLLTLLLPRLPAVAGGWPVGGCVCVWLGGFTRECIGSRKHCIGVWGGGSRTK